MSNPGGCPPHGPYREVSRRPANPGWWVVIIQCIRCEHVFKPVLTNEPAK